MTEVRIEIDVPAETRDGTCCGRTSTGPSAADRGRFAAEGDREP